MVRCDTKENPSDLGTTVLEKEAMTRCMNMVTIVLATTLRGAIVAIVAQVRGTNKQVDSIVNGCWVGQDERIMCVRLPSRLVRWQEELPQHCTDCAAMGRGDAWVRHARASVEVLGTSEKR